MDVTLPDGTVIYGVPDDISKADLTARLARNGYDVSKLQPKPARGVAGVVGDVAAGALRGAGSIGATILAPKDMLDDALAGKGWSLESNRQRRADMDAALRDLGADTDSLAYSAGKIGGEVAGTLGAGPALAAGTRVAKVAPSLAEAIATGGFRAAGATGARGVATRAAGGAIAGGASAGLASPEDAAFGAGIGAALPPVLQAAGKVGRVGGSVLKSPQARRSEELAKSLDLQAPEQVAAAVARLRGAQELVPGSAPTVAQVLQTPQASILQRVIHDSAGGAQLQNQLAAQQRARLAALEAQGAQTYTGAAKDEGTRLGDRIGAVLRTQAADDQQAARQAWEGVYDQGAQEAVALRLPLDEMTAAMAPLGRGTVGAGKDARALVDEAHALGLLEIPAGQTVKPSGDGKTLAQAVRQAGGIATQGDLLAGESRDIRTFVKNLGRKDGRTLDRMAEAMHEAGYIADEDPNTLLAALRDEATGSPRYSVFDDMSAQWGARAEAAMGDAPAATSIARAVPFDEFQRLRRSAGALGAKVGERAGGGTEAGVLTDLQKLLEKRVDDAAAGNLQADEWMPEGFRERYNAARAMTRDNAERYKGGDNIASILRKPVGQDYALTGDEITSKLWHGGQGLKGDVYNLKKVLSDNNLGPVMKSLQEFVMTDAASRTTATGDLAAALPRYVEQRLPGLEEALTDEQLKTLLNIAEDIKRAEKANALGRLRGTSSTYQTAQNALNLGLLDNPALNAFALKVPLGGQGLAWARDTARTSKAKRLAGLLSDAGLAADALDYRPAGLLINPDLARIGYLSAPGLAAGR